MRPVCAGSHPSAGCVRGTGRPIAVAVILFRRAGSSADPGREAAGIDAGVDAGIDDAAAPGPRRTTLRVWLRYRFDLALARGPLVVVGYLGLITLTVVVLAASALTVLGLTGIDGDVKDRLNFAEAFWQSLLRVLDTGTFASDLQWPTRLIALFVTLTGIFVAGSLIGVIANALDQRFEEMRKGRSFVLERGHTLVLGWSPRLPVILSQTVVANGRRRRGFVVLSQRPSDEMSDELHRLVPRTGSTRVVCRTGDTGNPDDLSLVNIEEASAVIVLAGAEGDAGVVKAVLAVRSVDPTLRRFRVVAELESLEHATTLRMLTDQRIATVQAEEVIRQVTAQACHQSGLASVFRDLLDFEGDEIYLVAVPQLVGSTFGAALTAFEQSSVIGVARNGAVRLAPDLDLVIAPGDEMIVITADEDAVIFTGTAGGPGPGPAPSGSFTEPAQRIAVIGWSALGADVVSELDEFLGPGSVVDVVVDQTVLRPQDVVLPPTTRCRTELHWVAPEPGVLIDLLAGRDYDQAIVLGYRRRMSPDQADARSMLTLLALHNAWAHRPRRPRIVAEMLDRANVGIAQTTGVDDFIVSDELSSLMIAQLAHRLELRDVFAELFGVGGSYVSLYPAPLFVPDAPVRYTEVVTAAAARGECAVGYRIGRDAAVLNPPKSAEVRLGPGDQVLVLGPRLGRPQTDAGDVRVIGPVALTAPAAERDA